MEKKKISIYDGRGKLLDFESFVRRSSRVEPNFWTKYAVYKDMRNRGYIVKTALKFAQARLSPPTFAQIASEAALDTPKSYFDEVIVEYKDRRDTLIKELKKLPKLVAKTGVLYESKKLYENQVSDWIRRVLSGKKYQIEPKAAQMLVEFLGADLSKISNELDKLLLILPKEQIITASHIEDNIGISKDFNNFELRKSLGEKNIVKANRIINYFSENPKNNPLVMTISLLNSFFTQLLMFHALQDKSKNAVAKAIGVSPYFVDEYFLAARNYPMRKVASIIALLREADVKSKGVGANQSQNDILKELLFSILH